VLVMETSYRKLFKSGELGRRVNKARQILKSCTLCPRRCKVNRLAGKLGFCLSGTEVVISSAGPHYGEEPPISGSKGSGAIFFTGCNLRCLFCQNYQISQEYEGHPVNPVRSPLPEGEGVPMSPDATIRGTLRWSPKTHAESFGPHPKASESIGATSNGVKIETLAGMMLSLENQRCHNINLVSPTHFVPQILEALLIAVEKGLTLPLVYNTNGYDTIETLKLLDGIIDIYLPDIKYSDNKYAKEYSGVKNYVKYNRLALKEMFRQVGNLIIDENGIAQRGVLIRHLVLPERIAGSFESLDFIAEEISKEAHISLMSQYHPCYKADKHPVVNRRLKKAEYDEVVEYAEKSGLENCYIQELASSDDFLPDFRREKPFER